jgi:hypothetical protein
VAGVDHGHNQRASPVSISWLNGSTAADPGLIAEQFDEPDTGWRIRSSSNADSKWLSRSVTEMDFEAVGRTTGGFLPIHAGIAR